MLCLILIFVVDDEFYKSVCMVIEGLKDENILYFLRWCKFLFVGELIMVWVKKYKLSMIW